MIALRRLISCAIVAALAGFAVYLWQRPGSALRLIAPAPAQSPVSLASKPLEPDIHYPVPDEGGRLPKGGSAAGAESKPLPAVDESDPTILSEMTRIFGPGASLFYPKETIRRIVVSVDNLTQWKQPSARFLPLQSPEGMFQATQTGEGQFIISPSNYGRYAPYVSLVRAADMKKVVAVYVRFYPLFQSAYSDLGTPGYFNDRLVQVVDNLLATPDVGAPIQLVLPSVYYKYTAPQFEVLSSGQRLLARMGPDNEKAIKAELRLLRKLLTSLPSSEI